MQTGNDERLYPSSKEAEKILREAEECNPGSWGAHSRCVAKCARRIAAACGDLNPDKAYVLGLLHDIGRKFGTRHLGHVYDGWKYMERLGYPEAAKVCLTHSFVGHTLDGYIGKFDILPEEESELRRSLEQLEFDDYDRLIQLCDAIGTADGPVQMEERMRDVKERYGSYPEEMWNQNLALREEFEKRTGSDIYELVR
ncbi:MAG: HD domain-containing protein [Clostridium sp.]|nr:HD domain-containing protein [Acetatifactor muris]MCM1527957.1 HD domain-containing protein [Bacteroides sp.]MCM1562407.1 HD domain-containing protein [Clostridium sp.]